MTVEVSITGLDNFMTICDPVRFTTEMDKAIQQSAEVLRDKTKLMPPVSAKTTGYGVPGIPVDTGRMRQAIQSEKLGLMAAGVIANTDYSGVVHDGSGRMPARPFFQYLLDIFGGLQTLDAIIQTALERIVTP